MLCWSDILSVKEEFNISKPVLIIDPGHGGKDLGGGSNSFFKEKDIILKISLYQFNRFRELNVPVKITRTKDVYLSPANRTKMIRDSGAKYCISNHVNAAAAPKAKGVETIHSIYSDGKLAGDIYQAIVDAGMHGRRVFSRKSKKFEGRDYYFIHRKTGAVMTTIIEYGFATNAEDTKLLIHHWKKYAEAVVKAYCEYIGHSYQPHQPLPKIKSRAKVKLEEKVLPAFITNEGRTVIEVRSIAKILDLDIEWDDSTKTVLLKRREMGDGKA